jgi:hypothetical protein
VTVRRVAIGLVLLALAVAARGLERRTTWYLASDQFAFLTFADDLRHGSVFHDPDSLAVLAAGVPRGETVDVYYQTYLWRDGKVFSRYPPGFPLLLALAGAVGGERAEHLVNPLLYLVLLAALAWLTHRLLDGAPPGLAPAAAAAAPWALLVLPAEVHYWGITVVRDLPAHLLAIGALAAACTGRFALAGLALGIACTMRPDAILYSFSLGALALVLRPRGSALMRGSLAFLAGVAPLLAYNTITQGHPLAFTQGMEFRHLLGAAPGRDTVAMADVLPRLPLTSGGGFQIRNLPRVLPANLSYLAGAFGLFLLPALGALRRRLIAAALGPHALASVLFFSCWGHGDSRYMVGVVLALIVLTAAGTARWCATLSRASLSAGTRLVLIALTLVAVAVSPAVFPSQEQRRLLELVVGTGAALVGAAAFAPALAPAAAAIGPLVPALAFAGVGLVRVAGGSGTRDRFQEDQMIRARDAVESLVPPGALVITTPALGRPAENITHYTHAEAHYDGEFSLLGSDPAEGARRWLATGRRVFVLLPGKSVLGPDVVEVGHRSGTELRDWFVDPAHTADAVLVELKPRPGR